MMLRHDESAPGNGLLAWAWLLHLIRSNARVLRFGIVGVAATAVHVGTVVVLVESGLQPNPLLANLIAFSLAVFVSYFGHNLWTFRARERNLPQFLRFLVTTVVALGLNQLILYIVVRLLHWDYRIGLLLVTVLVPLFVYTLARLWVFRSA
jgi:putative flippase GtrA